MSSPAAQSGPGALELLATLDKYGDFGEAGTPSTRGYGHGIDVHDGGVGDAVLLTGTTGRFGAYLLAQMLVGRRVSKIYALNRANEVPLKRRQLASFQLYNLDTYLLEDTKLELIVCDTAQEKFGLPDQKYNEVSWFFAYRSSSLCISF